MKKPLYYIFFFIISIIIQLKFKLFLPDFKQVPDFLLIMVVFTALFSGSRTGVIIGFLVGLTQDIFLGGIFGSYTLIKSVLGGAAGLMEGKIYKKNILIPPLIVFIISFLQDFFIILFSERMLFNIDFWQVLKIYILPFSFYNMIFSSIIYVVSYLICFSRGNYYE